MSDRKPTSIILPAAVALTVLLGLYVGAYYAMVEPMTVFPVEYQARYHFPEWMEPTDINVAARVQSLIEPIFRPIHWFDRRVRPHIWDVTPWDVKP